MNPYTLCFSSVCSPDETFAKKNKPFPLQLVSTTLPVLKNLEDGDEVQIHFNGSTYTNPDDAWNLTIVTNVTPEITEIAVPAQIGGDGYYKIHAGVDINAISSVDFLTGVYNIVVRKNGVDIDSSHRTLRFTLNTQGNEIEILSEFIEKFERKDVLTVHLITTLTNISGSGSGNFLLSANFNAMRILSI